MPNISYPFDATGVSVFNYIVREPHVLSEINSNSKRTIIPVFAPFYQNNFIVEYKDVNGLFTTLVQGVDYDYGLRFMGATVSLGKTLYGGVIIEREFLEGMIYLTYQTLGGMWVADRNLVLESLASSIYNPRMGSWDQITNVQETFPPGPHTQPIIEYRGMEDLIAVMNDVKDVLAIPKLPSLFYQQQTLVLLTQFENLRQEFLNLYTPIDYSIPIQALQGTDVVHDYEIELLKNRTSAAEGDVTINIQNIYNLGVRVDALENAIGNVNSEVDGFRVTLEGPTAVRVGETVEVKITDYETYGNYVITTHKVNVVRIGKILQVTGVLEGGDAWFNVSGSNFPMNVTAGIIYEIQGPSTGAEGSSVTFTLTTTAPNGTVLYWETAGSVGLTSSDFTDGLLTGSVTVNNGSASIIRPLFNDSVSDSLETFAIVVHTESLVGPLVATSPTLTVYDLVEAPVYSFVSAPSSVEEGSSAIITFSATQTPDGTNLYWTTIPSSGVIAVDFTDNVLSGIVTINSGVGVVSRSLVMDGVVETGESFSIALRTGSDAGPVVATSSVISVINRSNTPVYGISGPTGTTGSDSKANEGDTLVYTVTATNTPNATVLYWTILNNLGVNAVDFTGAALNGTTIVTNGVATISRTIAVDTLIEDKDSFSVQVRTGSITGPVVASSLPIEILDLGPTYAIANPTGSTGAVGTTVEGDVLTYSVTTTNVANGTLLYWSTLLTGATSVDFADNALTGSTAVSNGSASIVRTIASDALSETGETFTIQLRTSATNGPIVATSTTLTIAEPTPVYSVTPNILSVEEENYVNFNIVVRHVPVSTVLYYTVNGTNVSINDFSSASDANTNLAASFTRTGTLTSSVAVIRKLISQDNVTDEPEVFRMQIRTGSVNGPVVATSADVTILTNHPDNGTLLSSYCVGENKKGVYANGSGGTYEAYIKYYDIDCGYSAEGDALAVRASDGLVALATGSGGLENYQTRIYIWNSNRSFNRKLRTPTLTRGTVKKVLFHPINQDLYIFNTNGYVSRYDMSSNSDLPLWTRHPESDYSLDTLTSGYLVDADVLPSGKFIIAFNQLSTGGSAVAKAFTLFRLHDNGTIDTTFGLVNLKPIYTRSETELYTVNKIAVQSDGKIIAVGMKGGLVGQAPIHYHEIVRILANGSGLDTTFGNLGRVNFPSGVDDYTSAEAVAITTENKIYVAGNLRSSFGNPSINMMCITSSGVVEDVFEGSSDSKNVLYSGGDYLVSGLTTSSSIYSHTVTGRNGSSITTNTSTITYSDRSPKHPSGRNYIGIRGNTFYVAISGTEGTIGVKSFSLTSGGSLDVVPFNIPVIP